ncbi:TLD-domain-containing protein [Marasmius fiardii PR-910]|nr:TLD-domain-containing protein [Marasmius fiardii PR-910]
MASTHTKQNYNGLDEAMIDKFATLFSPPTPRASPTREQDSIWKTPAPTSSSKPPHQRTTSSDSDFGAFVSVSEDPLDVAAFSPVTDTGWNATPSNLTTTTTASTSPPNAMNHSLSFFEEFTREAKDANERNRRGILNELEGDVMFSNWTEGLESASTSSDGLKSGMTDSNNEDFFNLFSSSSSSSPPPSQNNSTPHDPNAWGPPELTQSLIDLDHDFFAPPRGRNHRRAITEGGQDHSYSSRSPPQPSLSSPTRSPTLSTPTVAPPVASTSAVSSSSLEFGTPFGATTRPRMTDRDRASSYQTLTNISSKWIGGLLSSSSSAPLPSSTTTNTNNTAHSASATITSTTQKVRASVDSFLGSFTEGEEAIRHQESPFARHRFVVGSISGAPGFLPDDMDGWDKGYSEMIREEVGGGGGSSKESELSLMVGRGREETMGRLIERKMNGAVELKGRKESTDPVLDRVLAEKIRSHLPPLSRLHRSWNLLYSLDQHGISLNTLYAKSESSSSSSSSSGLLGPTKVGALLVIKDSCDTSFGVFLSDGLKRGDGRSYSGSGESFMWRYPESGGSVEIFKWTGKNEYVALCGDVFLSFGGGDGTYGLYVNENLLEGSSAPCPTFDNPPLCSVKGGVKKGREVLFECVGVEVWGVGS